LFVKLSWSSLAAAAAGLHLVREADDTIFPERRVTTFCVDFLLGYLVCLVTNETHLRRRTKSQKDEMMRFEENRMKNFHVGFSRLATTQRYSIAPLIDKVLPKH